jgi:ATP-dependent protease ClpP protease subunit
MIAIFLCLILVLCIGTIKCDDNTSSNPNDGDVSTTKSTDELSDAVFAFEKHDTIELKEGNHVILRGVVDEAMVAKLIVKMTEIAVDNDEVLMYIVSPGGSVLAGNNLIQYMNYLRHQGKTMTCIADQAASMAFSIFQECDNRYVMPTSILMQHQMSVGLEDQYENLKSRIKLLEAINKQSCLRQAARIGMTPEEFHAKILSDWWIYGDENVEANTADKVVLAGCTPTLALTTVEEDLNLGFFSLHLVYSGCPLSRFPLSIGNRNQCDETDVKCQADFAEQIKQLPHILRNETIRRYLQW